jgi:hypothetical protein
VRLFRVERIAKIKADEAPVPLEAGGSIVTHLVPLSAFAAAPSFDIALLLRNPGLLVRTLGRGGSNRYNLDGLVFAERSDQPCSGYLQVFRNGCIETVDSFSDEAKRRQALPSVAFERGILDHIRGGKQLFQSSDIQPPVVILVTLLGMKGWRMGGESWRFGGQGGTFDRDPLLIPEITLQTFSGDAEVEAQPLLDMIWNAAGWPGSNNYDSKGQWRSN